MFRIPSHYLMENIEDMGGFKPGTNWADSIIKRLTISGALIDGLEYMNKRWEEHCKDEDGDDDDFFENWIHEVNAFNVVFAKFAPLFAPKECQ
jgi:hypothetical protein